MKQTPEQYAHIVQYLHAAEEMLRDNYDVLIHIDDDDHIGKLGRVLIDIGKKLKTQSGYIHTISTLVDNINAGHTTEEILNQIYDTFHDYIPYDRMGFARINSDTQTAVALWCRSNVHTIKLGKSYEAPLNNSSLKEIIETKRPRIINDLAEYYEEHPLSESTRLIIDEGMRSNLTCPLFVEDKPIGFLFFSSREPYVYKDAHTELFLQLAVIIAGSIHKAGLYERLVELNEVKNQFLGMTVHDLRNPIAIIKGFLELLLLQDNDDYSKKILEHIQGQADKMIALISDLLDISAIESGKVNLNKNECDIADVVNDSVQTNRLIARGKEIKILTEIPDVLPSVYIDKTRIIQVLDNLLSNAIKFSDRDTMIKVIVGVENDTVCVSVMDCGQGIPKKQIPKLFQPFSKIGVSPTEGEKSTGLGLAIVKKIIDLHHGTLSVKSETGEGTTISFCLPVAGK